ncbi:MAG: hypothetical protein M3R37_10695 [Actinomycetota bacterium]|nr:hypothetical protein [Actinomycetota bacterium]
MDLILLAFANLLTLEDVEAFIANAYHMSVGAPLRCEDRPKLPLAVASPGPLMEHVVRLSGTEGLTLQELQQIFHQLGKKRYDEGLVMLREFDSITEARERRPNKAGRPEEQVVLRLR